MSAARGPVTAAIDLAAEVLGPLAERDVPLGPLTTYRVGWRGRPPGAGGRPRRSPRRRTGCGHVRAAGPGRGTGLEPARRRPWLRRAGHRARPLGATRSPSTAPIVTAGGAVSLPVLARQTVGAGLTGLEWAVGVPGSVGGGVRMNAGGHGSDVASSLVGVRVFDLRSGEDCGVPAQRAGPAVPGLRPRLITRWSCRRGSSSAPAIARRRRRRWPRSSAGGGSTSPAARTPARSSSTRFRASCRPASSSTPSVCGACASARRRCRRSTPTSSRPTRVAGPTTCGR